MLPFLLPKPKMLFFVLGISLLCLASFRPASAQVAVLTQNNDNARTGANLQEKILKPSNVTPKKFGKLYAIAGLDNQVNGQVLYVPNVVIGGVSHNVMYASTSSNGANSSSSVYAFDADTAIQLWRMQLPNSAEYTTPTPVIDAATNIIYVLSQTDPSYTGATFLHAIDITTGAEKPGSPVQVAASAAGIGEGNLDGLVFFDGLASSTAASFNGSTYTGRFQSNDRAALLLLNGVVYTAYAHANDSSPYHGWVLGYQYDGTKFTQTSAFCATPNGGGGGIWQSGKGLAADADGYIYCATGNGTFDVNTGGQDYGMTYLKLHASDLSVADWFTPFDGWAQSAYDYDLGNAGVTLIPGTKLLFGGATKFGTGFLLDSTHLGGFTLNGPDNVVLRMDGLTGTDSVGQNPICWDASALKYVYLWATGSNLQQFALDPNLGTFTATGDPTHIFKQNSVSTRGSALAISANGSKDGILWAVDGAEDDPYINTKTLRAFDATDVSKPELWDSEINSARDRLSFTGHFQFPTVVNGKVFVPFYDVAHGYASIAVYGLLPLVHLAPVADAVVRGGQYTDTNFGSDTLLICKRLTSDATSPFNRADYLKFDLTGVTNVPSQALLTMTVNPVSRPAHGFETIQLYSVADTSWTESGITWNNAPGLSGDDFSSTGTLLSVLSVPMAIGTVSFDITPFIQANLGHIVTLQLMDASATSNYLAFNSRNAVSGQPQLTLVP
jgi:hypothetical protein